MKHFLALAALTSYGLSAAVFLYQVAKRRLKIANLSRYLFALGFVFHSGALATLLTAPSMIFLDNGADYFFWVSWGLALVLILLRDRIDFPIVGSLAVPLVMVFMGSSSYLLHGEGRSLVSEPIPTNTTTTQEFLLLSLHAVPAFLAVVSLALAFIVSYVFVIVEGRIRRRTANAISSPGPNLQALDKINWIAVVVGFIGITLVVLSGSFWALSAGRPLLTSDVSILSGIALWFLLGFILHARSSLGWSARRMSKLTALVTGLFFVSIFIVLFASGRLTHDNLL